MRLNYNHLFYFWTVIREGGIVQAARVLHLTPQTVSGQIKQFERQTGTTLLERQGRKLVPTDVGRRVYERANDIFAQGAALADVLHGESHAGRTTVTIGISDAVHKLMAWRVLAPLLAGPEPFHLVCESGPFDWLIASLGAQQVDLVLSSSPLSPEAGIRAFSHLLGESDVSFFAVPELAKRLRKGFPQSLNGAPFLLASERSPNRRVLEAWFAEQRIRPSIVAEFDDSAMITTFGQGGAGVFAAPAAIEKEVMRQLGVALVGRTDEPRARLFAISTERRLKHPAVVALTQRARADVFAPR